METDPKYSFTNQVTKLTAPFPPDEIRTRSQAGRNFSYVTARTIMNRLDNVVGVLNWWDEYELTPHGSICRLSIRFKDGSIVTKCDIGGDSATPDAGDNAKGGVSDAFKRAAVKFGIGRHLYGEGVPSWHIQEPASPSPRPASSTPRQVAPTQQPAQQRKFELKFEPPSNPKAYFAWMKNLEEHYQTALIPFVNEYCKGRNIPTFTNKWTDEMAGEAFAELISFIRTLPQYKDEFGPATTKDDEPYGDARPENEPDQTQTAAADDDIPF